MLWYINCINNPDLSQPPISMMLSINHPDDSVLGHVILSHQRGSSKVDKSGGLKGACVFYLPLSWVSVTLMFTSPSYPTGVS